MSRAHGWQFQATQKVDDCHLIGGVWPLVARVAPGPGCHSPVSLPLCILVLTHSRSVFSSCVVSGSLCLVPLATAGVAVHSIPVVTTVQLAQWQGFWGEGCVVDSAAARVCRDAGARVSLNVRVQDLDLARPDVLDNRRLEIVADGLSLFHGAQLAIDTTVVSVLKRDGTPHQRCADVDGAALLAARRRLRPPIPSLVAGRWSDECLSFLRQLARAKVRSEPPHLKVRARRAWLSRWSIMLSCSAARTVALSLLERRGGTGSDGEIPSMLQVLADARDAGVP